jgi:glycosyltransferase involved in cell wall biosynthesis
VATITPRKDHPTLLRALARLRDLRWRASFVGPLDRDPAQTRTIRAMIASLRLGRRVRLAGERDAGGLAREYSRAHVFALPSRHEGYGMAFAEALAHRLPVACVAAGAVPSVVPRKAGILVRAGDDRALARALRKLLGPARTRYAANAARLRFPGWAEQAARLRIAIA